MSLVLMDINIQPPSYFHLRTKLVIALMKAVQNSDKLADVSIPAFDNLDIPAQVEALTVFAAALYVVGYEEAVKQLAEIKQEHSWDQHKELFMKCCSHAFDYMYHGEMQRLQEVASAPAI